MRRAAIGGMLGVVLAAGPAVPAVASGGGGCGGPITEAKGDAVAIRQFCFEPTVLVAPAGGEVTFVNEDGFPHNVLGANGAWGSYARMNGGKVRSYTFTDPGVYPYVCTWHPGMVGTVVVGEPGGSIQTLEARPAAATTEGSDPWKVAAVASAALLVLTVIGAAGLRKRSGQGPAV
jgi:plastocyanin